ncbi:hypothetical protein FQ775_16210 [Nitratireductor mangrovi]|uniref:Uncharacterized protein n=1 Tax=Nitratireductor mangrovi TaxID=2599600 RepID=A0A5B8L1U6_9HYPH|nr:hypothetical protein [Nitratireductor mangrovi]QDZ01793.1 hypothetical protein FQ775_16210 [Nitratireductor mangrovi]
MKRILVSAVAAAIVVPAFASQLMPSSRDRAEQPGAETTARLAPGRMCGERAMLAAELERQFGELQVATGLVDRSAIMEIFVSHSGTWTILATGTDGASCVVAAGDGFDTGKPVQQAADS